MIDADHDTRSLSNKVAHLGTREASRRGWLSIGSSRARRRDRQRHRSCPWRLMPMAGKGRQVG
jgi:hypothetical protein